MGWRELPAWVKGGVVGALIGGVLVGLFIVGLDILACIDSGCGEGLFSMVWDLRWSLIIKTTFLYGVLPALVLGMFYGHIYWWLKKEASTNKKHSV